MRKKASDEGTQGEGLVVKGNHERGRSNTRNGSSGNKSRSKLGRKKDIQCYKCRKKGHMKRECSNRKKGNDDKEGSSKSANIVEEQGSESSDEDMLSISSDSEHLVDSWILDSTCSFHVTPNKDWFDTYRLVNSDFVQMDNDASCKVIGIGNIRIKMFDGVVRTLCDVMHVPDLKKNLISLGALNSNGFCYTSESGVMKVSKGIMTVMKG